ncbi:hypothetical protein HJC23_011421 [Cyclotella cryptica]|uniref:Uncharacterized protein n=1 Tax=Cyclotella cryptica TaxID=29204 RepID=A0ABD3PK69_9STRA
MRIATSSLVSLLLLLQLSLPHRTNATRQHHNRRRRHHHRNNTTTNNSINSSLIQTKSLTQSTSTTAAPLTQHTFPWHPQQSSTANIHRAPFGPKQRGQLCDALTSAAPSFDVDSSEGLDWNEFYAFTSAIVDAVSQSPSSSSSSSSSPNEMNAEQMGKVYHDMTCECHFTYQLPLSCCHGDDGPTSGLQKIQVTLLGLNDNDDATDEEKQYRRNFCNGIMFILESEGLDLEIVADGIESGLNVNVTDVPVIDAGVHDDDASHVVEDQQSSGGGSTIATVTTSVSVNEESLSNTETLSTGTSIATNVGHEVESSSTIDNDSGVTSSNINNDTSGESTADQTLPTGSSTESTLSSSTEIVTTATSSTYNTQPLQPDASTSAILSDSTAEITGNTNAGLSIGATIGIILAALAVIVASIMAIIHRKRQEQQRLAEFAGEELVDHDLDAESLPKDNVVAMETMQGEKVYAELTPETTEEHPMDVDEMNGSEVSSVVSVEHDEECAQISFEEQDGGVEARVTVGSTLAAMGVASTVTGRLTARQGRRDD